MRDDSKTSGTSRHLLLMVPFLAFYLVQLVHHQLWRDEINAWYIVCVSQSVGELLHRVHYEAHPALWYLLLYPFSKLTHAPWMLKAIGGTSGVMIYLMLALTTPFKRLELALIFLGYYVSFQYTVMSRMYGLEVLFALVYVWLRMRHPERMARNAIWLGLIANVDATGGILALGLLLEYSLERYQFHRKANTLRWQPFAATAGVFAGLSLISAATLWPAKDIGWSATGPLFSQLFSGEHLGSSFAKWGGLAFFPQTMDPVSLWYDPHGWPHGVIVPFVLALFYFAFRHYGRMALMLGSITVMGIFFSDATSVSGIRHIGILYIAFVLALWMLRYQGVAPNWASYALLGLTVVATGYNVHDQWGRPFSDDDATARWLVDHHLQDVPLLGSPDTNVIGVPERLERPLFQIECQCWDRVLMFSHRRDGFHWDTDVPKGVVRGMQKIGASQAIFLGNRELTLAEQGEMQRGGVIPALLVVFDKGYVPDEHFYVYRLTASP
jgi:hypothetical protein